MSRDLAPKRPDLGDIAERINAEHDALERAWSAALGHAKAAGVLLSEAKAALPFGKFGPWIKQNCKFSDRTAQLYMQISQRWAEIQSNPQHVAEMSLRKAIEIIAPKKAAPTITPASQHKPATVITVESQERSYATPLTDDPPPSPLDERGPISQPGPTSTSQAFASHLRRDPTPEERAENEMRDQLSRVVVQHVQDWHRENRNATVELICDALRDVVIRLQDGEVELDGGGA